MLHLHSVQHLDEPDALKPLECVTMLLKGILHMSVPVLPGVPARMFKIGMRNTSGFEKGMKAAIVIEQVILRATVEREMWHCLRVEQIDKRIAIKIGRST